MLAVVVGGVCYRLATGSRGPQTAAWTVGGDYPSFHMAARILNEGQGDRLYDLTLQESVFRDLVPEATGLSSFYPYPPFIAALFRPLALFPMPVGLAIFLIVSPLTYVAALWLLIRQLGPDRRDERALVIAAGLSFLPYVGYTWLGAQITFIAFAAVALAVVEDERGRGLRSGMALSLCLYKPTLLLLILPMLVVTGRLRHLLGLAAGAALLAMVSIATAGTGSIVAYIQRMLSLAETYGSGQTFLNPYRFVDINSFFRMLPYGRSTLGSVVCAGVVIAAAAALVHLWVDARSGERQTTQLVWAATITWTAVLNVYTSGYDTILVVVAALLAFAAMRGRGWIRWRSLSSALTVLYVAPWVAEVSAPLAGVQAFTIALAWFGTLLIMEARRKSSLTESTAWPDDDYRGHTAPSR